MNKDLDADVQTIMLTAQAFATYSAKKARASDATQNTRLAILCSFYDYAIPMLCTHAYGQCWPYAESNEGDRLRKG